MRKILAAWVNRYFADPDAVTLFLALVTGGVVLTTMGGLLLPVILSIFLAYILRGIVKWLQNYKCPHLLAVIVAYLLFLSVLLLMLLWLLPLIWQQLEHLFAEIPKIYTQTQHWLINLQQRYPDLISLTQLKAILAGFKEEFARLGHFAVSFSIASISGVVTTIVYLVLVPLTVFFLLKDAEKITCWITRYLPAKHNALAKVWHKTHAKIGSYVRGRVLEMLLVGLVTAIGFTVLGLKYAVLLGTVVGVSVIVPYLGAIIVTVPVIVVALMQWGLQAHFVYLLIFYALVIGLDANLLVPMLFAEALDLHPVVIILSVLIFGGLWGFWGVFFAIPLAGLIDAVLDAWPRS